MCEFYEGWEDDWQSGYDMTNEEWDEAHEPYDPKALRQSLASYRAK